MKTRWLSLGQSLERVIEIWPSLMLYMNTMFGKKGGFISEFLKAKKYDDSEITSVNYENISNLLNDDLFFYKFAFFQ